MKTINAYYADDVHYAPIQLKLIIKKHWFDQIWNLSVTHYFFLLYYTLAESTKVPIQNFQKLWAKYDSTTRKKTVQGVVPLDLCKRCFHKPCLKIDIPSNLRAG